MKNIGLPYPWDAYADFRDRLETTVKMGPTAWATEEQLDEIIDLVARGKVPIDPAELDRKLRNLLLNRARKHRIRNQRLQENTGSAICTPEKTETDLINKQQVKVVRQQTTKREFRVLMALAHEADYQTVARMERNCKVNRLKTMVSRCRRRLREKLAA